jgi:hypothetical protein
MAATRTMAFVVSNKHLPCDPEYLFTARVFGVNGQYTNVTWDPPRYLGQPKIDVYIKGTHARDFCQFFEHPSRLILCPDNGFE